jgi:hypothetical protein
MEGSGFQSTVVPARTGTYVRWFADGNRRDRYTFPSAARHVTFGVTVAVHRKSGGTSAEFIRLLGDDAATTHITLGMDSNGRLIVRRGLAGTVLGQTDINVLPHSGFRQVEVKVTLSDTVGAVELRVDGKVPSGWSDLSGVDTKNGGTATVFDTVHVYGGGVEWYADDLVIWNGAGSINNNFFGVTRVYSCHPNGNGAYSELVGSDGNSVDNYLQVDESTPYSIADYNGSATVGNKDSYAFADLPVATGNVRGVIVSMIAFASDGGAKSIRALARRAAVDATGADFTLSTSPAVCDQVWEVDPTDAAAWTVTRVNASEFGAEART